MTATNRKNALNVSKCWTSDNEGQQFLRDENKLGKLYEPLQFTALETFQAGVWRGGTQSDLAA